ncbi:MAG: F0F1 ATP synthase subunit alpha, partial [Negativicutes bacterium]
YTAVHGYLADIAVDKVVTFQRDFLKFMYQNHPEIGKEIAAEKKLDDNIEAALKKAIEEFKETIPYKMA